MPTINNVDNNISLEISLENNEYLDLDISREDFENWIPFILQLKIEDESYEYVSESGATFSLHEIEQFIFQLKNIIALKEQGRFEQQYSFYCSEGFFQLILSEPLEVGILTTEIWLNMGVLTKGFSYGYDKGFRFVISVGALKTFVNELEMQLGLLKNL